MPPVVSHPPLDPAAGENVRPRDEFPPVDRRLLVMLIFLVDQILFLQIIHFISSTCWIIIVRDFCDIMIMNF